MVFSSLRYRNWEKARRDRFNDELTNLGKELPQFNSEKPWTKAEIVQNARDYIKKLEKLKRSAEDEKKIKLLKRQNRKLRELIRHEFGIGISEFEFVQKTLKEIVELVETSKNKRSKCIYEKQWMRCF